MKTLQDFVAESNRIEGIVRSPKPAEIAAHRILLALPELRVIDIVEFVHTICQAPLRDKPHLNVSVGNHIAPRGGPQIVEALRELLARVNRCALTPYAAHVAYETLHAFIDGNGRSGRAIWAWHMTKIGEDPFRLGFLHEFYYQALQASRPAPREPDHM